MRRPPSPQPPLRRPSSPSGSFRSGRQSPPRSGGSPGSFRPPGQLLRSATRVLRRSLTAELRPQKDVAYFATRVQRAFRAKRFMFRHLGPICFCRKGGAPPAFGLLSFGNGLDRKPYLVSADTSSAELLTTLLLLYWRVPKPEVIVSISGSMQDFALSPGIRRLLANGIVAAASSAKALFFTPGFDAGVAKLISAILNDYEVDAPCVGVCTLGCIKESPRLLGGGGGAPGEAIHAVYPVDTLANDQWGAALNAHHTHFIAVDSGWERTAESTHAPWGHELPLRAALEMDLASRVHVPIVQLVVQGGPGTVQFVLDAMRVGTPIVAVVESGGAARALYVAIELEDDASAMAVFAGGGNTRTIQEQLAAIRELDRAQGRTLLHFFNAPLPEDAAAKGMSSGASSADASDPLSSFLLKAIVSRRMYSPAGHGAGQGESSRSSSGGGGDDDDGGGGVTKAQGLGASTGAVRNSCADDTETDEHANLASALTLAVICAHPSYNPSYTVPPAHTTSTHTHNIHISCARSRTRARTHPCCGDHIARTRVCAPRRGPAGRRRAHIRAAGGAGGLRPSRERGRCHSQSPPARARVEPGAVHTKAA